MMEQNHDSKSAPVAAMPKQVEDTQAPWGWVERGVWTERMLTRLASREPADREWFARRGLWTLTAAHEWTRTIVGLRTH